MTLLDEAPLTATGVPAPRAFLRRNRPLLLIAGTLIGALVVAALVTGVGGRGTLDPTSYEQSGGRALATLLRDQGIKVTVTTDVPSTLADAGDGTTIFVPTPGQLSNEELSELLGSGHDVVMAGVGPLTLEELGTGAHIDDLVEDKEREPGCGANAAVQAGTARLGGFTFTSDSTDAQRCYGGTLLIDRTAHLVLLGSGSVLSNERLGDQGDAELGLQLLGQGTAVHWLIPSADRTVFGTLKPHSLTDLLAESGYGWVPYAVLQLFVVLLVVALWRGRRLGRVVPEALPVVVRAAETVEGRGRLYRAAGSRGTAAEALRSGARDRLGRRLGAGRHPEQQALVEVVARRSGRPATEVTALLYGPPPVDDAALVVLARDLDSLIRSATSSQEVAGS